MYKLRRYHSKIWFPTNVGGMVADFLQQLPFVDVTNHGAEELQKDKRGIIPLPSIEEMFHNSNTLVEVYERLDNQNNPQGIAQKLVIRIGFLDDQYDYTYVLAREGFIVSAWAIDKGDHHRLTHSMRQYYMPESEREAIQARLRKEQQDHEQKRNIYASRNGLRKKV